MFQRVLNSLRPAVVAMIASAGISVLVSAFWGSEVSLKLANINWNLVIIFVICIFLLLKVKINPILVMVLAGILNGIFP